MPVSFQPADSRRALPDAQPRAACDLPDGAIVFCSYNQSLKITRPVFRGWCELLAAVPGSVLWLITMDAAAEASLRAFAAGRRIAPERIVFASLVDADTHIARLRAAD